MFDGDAFGYLNDWAACELSKCRIDCLLVDPIGDFEFVKLNINIFEFAARLDGIISLA